MYMLEGADQPAVFSSIPAAMWWAIETLTTVGYGDMVPVTAGGRLVGGIVSVIGIGTLALFTVGFLEQLKAHREQHPNAHPMPHPMPHGGAATPKIVALAPGGLVGGSVAATGQQSTGNGGDVRPPRRRSSSSCFHTRCRARTGGIEEPCRPHLDAERLAAG